MNTKWKEIRRIVPGHGGDSTLLLGSEKTALIDTGMTWCSDRLITLAEQELEGRDLDFVLLTHTHYDHAGGIPALKRRWPQLTVVASEYAKNVFQREGAQREMHRLAKVAAAQYLGEAAETPEKKAMLDYPAEQMQVDRVVKMDDRISLGDLTVKVLETPGHTNCSLSFYLEEPKILYHSESTGCYAPEGRIEPSVLTSFDQSLASTQLCKAQGAEHVISPHFGLVEAMEAELYFDEAIREISGQREFLRVRVQAGMTPDDILEDAIQEYYETRTISKEEQPLEAFAINTKATIRLIQKEEE
ncbi:MAG: MBL fold metallo-hydrolase [Firmicutes bacterium]|nr:MBL fold metallo-hydrolase [Bacillota bacterium]